MSTTADASPADVPARPNDETAPKGPDMASRTPPDAPPPRGADLVRLACGFYGIVALFAFGYALFSGTLRRLFGEAWPSALDLLGGLAFGLLLIVLSRAGARAWRPMRRTTDALADLIGPIGWRPALVLALLSGTAEEVLFRGALWPHLGLLGTTLLFGLVHVLPGRALWVYPLFATLAGLLFGLLRDATWSVWPCVVGHVLVNAVNLLWLSARARRRAFES